MFTKSENKAATQSRDSVVYRSFAIYFPGTSLVLTRTEIIHKKIHSQLPPPKKIVPVHATIRVAHRAVTQQAGDFDEEGGCHLFYFPPQKKRVSRFFPCERNEHLFCLFFASLHMKPAKKREFVHRCLRVHHGGQSATHRSKKVDLNACPRDH